MATPGHVKAAFEHLRGLAKKAQGDMMKQKRGPHLEAGAHVTDSFGPKDTHQLTPDPEEQCADCASGVCETHGTGEAELEAMQEHRHADAAEPKEHGHHDQSDEEPAEHGVEHEDVHASKEEALGHDKNQPNKGKKRKLGGHLF